MKYLKAVKMIDTIKLAITYDRYPDWLVKLQPRASLNITTGRVLGIVNPSASAKKAGVYLPNITYQQRPTLDGRKHDLYIQISLPKLVYGNNFSELPRDSFNLVVSLLTDKLNSIGIPVGESDIKNANISRVDFSKNIVFNNYTPVSTIISSLMRANTSRRYDQRLRDYSNGGYAYHAKHTNAIDVCIYDKIADLKQGKLSDKRAIEDDNYAQTDLLDRLLARKELSVVRIEVRLNSRSKIRYELDRLGLSIDNITLKELFNPDISKHILKDQWSSIITKIPKIPLDEESPENLLVEILKSQKITPMRAFAELGFLLAIKTSDNRHLRNILDQRFGVHAWGRINKTGVSPSESNLKNLLYISSEIDGMEPVDIRRYDL